MGTVHLTHSHHGLYIHPRPDVHLEERILLEPELLTRPIYNGPDQLKAPIRQVIHAALQGLMDLRDFNAAISYRVVEKDGLPHLAIPHRVWGEITLGAPDNVALGFSHDSRPGNAAYGSVLDWLEQERPEERLSNEEFAQFCMGWMSSERWRCLFEARLRRQIETLRSKARRLQSEAGVAHTAADLIRNALA